MTFINPDDYSITFSEPTIKESPIFLEVESEPILLQTKIENGLLVEVDSSVNFEIDCRNVCQQGIVDSGSFTMINSCTLPITVTGIKVSDSVRFSLFDFPNYTGVEVYSSGNVSQLPLTINPREKVKVNTYFHPLYEEIKYGNAGTPENRTGDKFGAEVQMLPGFPIINCNKSPCDASFILTGELLCPNEEHDLEWLENKKNFEESNDYDLPNVNNYFVLTRTQIVNYDHPDHSESEENKFDAIKKSIEVMAKNLKDRDFKNLYKDLGYSGCLIALDNHINNIQESGDDDDFDNLISINYNEELAYGGSYCVDEDGLEISCTLDLYREPFKIEGTDANGDQQIFYPMYHSEVDAENHVISINPDGSTVNAGSATEILEADTNKSDLGLPFSYPVWLADNSVNDCENQECPNFLQPNPAAIQTPFEDNLSEFFALTYNASFSTSNVVKTTIDGVEYTGLKFDLEGNPAAGFMSDKVIFYNIELGRAGSDVKMFVCEYGNFENEPLDPIEEV